MLWFCENGQTTMLWNREVAWNQGCISPIVNMASHIEKILRLPQMLFGTHLQKNVIPKHAK